MISRLDSQSLTKFLMSAGVFLLIAAFVMPALVLRETDVLQIPARELTALTPVARGELERRQHVARRVGKAVPIVAVLFVVGGLCLLGVGLPRLKQQEDKENERTAIELDTLKQLEPQTDTDVEERRMDEAKQEAPAAQSTSVDDDHERLQTWIQRGAKVEERTLERLAEITPSSYELRPRVKVAGTSTALFDALLLTDVDDLPDVVVEIKHVGSPGTRIVRNRLSLAVAQVVRYRTRLQRRSIGWLILVTTRVASDETRERIEALAAEFRDDLLVSIVSEDDLQTLSFPEIPR